MDEECDDLPDQYTPIHARGASRAKVFVVINFSKQVQDIRFEEYLHHGKYTDHFSQENIVLDTASQLRLLRGGNWFLCNRKPRIIQKAGPHKSRTE